MGWAGVVHPCHPSNPWDSNVTLGQGHMGVGVGVESRKRVGAKDNSYGRLGARGNLQGPWGGGRVETS